MIRLKDLSLQATVGLSMSCFVAMATKYNPLINYDWSTTTTSGLRYLKDVGSTPTYNASMYFGRGAYLNGVDQYSTLGSPSNYNLTNTFTVAFTAAGIGSVIGIEGLFKIELALATRILILKQNYWGAGFGVTTDTTIMSNYLYTYDGYTETLRKNGVIIYSTVGHVFTFNMSTVAFGLGKVGIASTSYFKGTFKDVYLFNRVLTQSEITQAYEQPELFYAMAQADSTCVLNMPMCETSSTVRNYKTGINYAIINYTTSVRDNAKNLQYGLQTCKFVRDSLGVIQSASDYLESSGVGYADTGWIPSSSEDWTIECGFIAKMDSVIKRIGCGWINSTQVTIGETTSNRVQAYVGNKQAITTITNPNVEIILVKSNGYVLIYINKVQLINELIGLPFSPDEAFRLSGHRLWSAYPWNNTITKFKVHNKALTNEEIQAL